MAVTSQPALQYLSTIDQVIVKQEWSLIEVILPFEVGNKYSVFNILGQRLFYAAEDSNFCCKQCCGPQRPFVVKVTDNFGTPVLHVERHCNCGAFFPNCPCCSDSLTVNADHGEYFGSVQRKCNPCCPGYRILDSDDTQVLSVDGPCCCLLSMAQMCCRDQKFTITDDEGDEIGHVKKQFSGMMKEFFTDADVFSATFPTDLDVRLKAILLGSVFLIDFNFYEKPPDQK